MDEVRGEVKRNSEEGRGRIEGTEGGGKGEKRRLLTIADRETKNKKDKKEAKNVR